MAAKFVESGLEIMLEVLAGLAAPADFSLRFFSNAPTIDINTVTADLALVTGWDEGDYQPISFSVETGPDGAERMHISMSGPITFTNNTGGDLTVSGWALFADPLVNNFLICAEVLGSPIIVPNTFPLSWLVDLAAKSEF